MWRRWVILQNFFLIFIDHLWETWKIRILKKWKKTKKMLEISSFYTSVQKAIIIWSIYCSWDTELDRIFFVILGHLLALLLPTQLLTTQKTQILKKSKEKYLERSSFMPQLLLSILGCFLYFYPRNCLKNENFREWKKHLEISSF